MTGVSRTRVDEERPALIAELSAGLGESEERFRLAFEEAPVGMGLVGLDGHILRANKAFCRTVGYAPEELAGMHFREITHPEDFKADLALGEQLMRGEIKRYQLARRYVRKEGAIVHALLTCTIVRDALGQPLHFIGQIEDVTERQRIENERDESLRWLRAVLQQSPVALIRLIGAGGERIVLNAKAVELLGSVKDTEHCVGALLTPEGEPVDRDSWPGARALRGEQVQGVEYAVRTHEGTLIPVIAGASPILDSTGQVLGAVVVLQDIKPLKDLERVRAEWNSIIAHDLRQPLHAIGLHANALSMTSQEPAAVHRAGLISASARRLDRMISDLVGLSTVEAERLKLLRAPTDLAELVRTCVAEIALQVVARSFEVEFESPVPPMELDADRIAQVLDNLLTNALKYGDPGTPISVKVSQSEGLVTISVINRGAGIPQAELPILFKRFQRTAQARGSAIKGLGLGLFISRAVIEGHGGHIGVESTPGESTRFWFTLQSAPPAQAPGAHPSP